MDKQDKPSKEEALAVLQQERDERVKACGEKLQNLLKEYGCVLQARPFITPDGKISTELHLLPQE